MSFFFKNESMLLAIQSYKKIELVDIPMIRNNL